MIIERLAKDVLLDDYFIKLNNKAARLLAKNLFSEKSNDKNLDGNTDNQYIVYLL